ncbi:MAG: hypothetical protein LBL00_00025, partial [Endomicrobium sp.]|nr:hypothetical protein [Endomicrobium sp.]
MEEKKIGKAPRVIRLKTKHDDIVNFYEKALKKMGFDIKTEGSKLSSSRYITIINWEEVTGNESRYNFDELKIRLSGHDLPISYDRLHGFHDLDIMTDGKERGGNDGNAGRYDCEIEWIAKMANKPLPTHIVMLRRWEAYKREESARRDAEYRRLKREKELEYYSNNEIEYFMPSVTADDYKQAQEWAQESSNDLVKKLIAKVKEKEELIVKMKAAGENKQKRRRQKQKVLAIENYITYLYLKENGEYE